MSSTPLARARTEDLETQSLGDELLVYDRRSNEVHCLNADTARVWNSLADGDALASLSAELGADIVADAIESFRAKDLLIGGEHRHAVADPISRRQAVRRMAAMATAGAAILTVAAPPAAWAASCAAVGQRDNGCPCTNGGQCTTGNCPSVPGQPRICKPN